MRTMMKALLATAAALSVAPAAQAADLLAPVAPLAPAVVAPTVNWEGAYIGANVGYGWGTLGTPVGSFDLNGGMIGGQIGYNFYLSDGVVLGIQGDADWQNQKGSGFSVSTRIDWTAALTGHIGFAWDAVMPYVLGGVAFAGNTFTVPAVPGSDSQTHVGWTVGGGLEVMLADNLSAFAEYRYADYGSKNYTVGGATNSLSLTDNTVRAGLNFHF